MTGPIVYIDHSEIRAGRIEDLKAAMSELAEFVDTQEPQLAFYGFYLDEDATQMTVVAVHPDSASLELHLEVGDAAFRKFRDLLTLQTIEVYGRPSAKALEQLRAKAQMLGAHQDVVVHDRHAGFTRLWP